MKQRQLARLLGISDRKLRMMSKEELAKFGWVKVGSGKGCYYREVRNGKGFNPDKIEAEHESLEEAKRRKLIAEANLAEQKYERERRRLFREWSDQFFTAFADSFSVLKNRLTEKRLDEKLLNEINEVFGECLDDLQSKLENILPGRNL